MIHLDTSFLIRSLAADSSESRAIRKWIGQGETLCMSALAWTEFLCGPLSTDEASVAGSIVTQRLPFGQNEAELAAYLFNEAGRNRGTIVDCMIAATAIRNDAPLATSDRRFFERLESFGLTLAEA